MKKPRKNQAHFSYILAVALCMIAVFGMLFFYYIRYFNQTLREENRSRLSEISIYITNYMEKMLSEQQVELELLASSVSGMDDRAEQVRFLGEMAEKLGLEYIGIAGRDGQFYAEALQEATSVSDEAFYKAAVRGEVYISDITRQIFYDRAVGGIILSVPVPGDRGQVIAAMISTAKLGEDVQVESFNGAGYSYIINAEGDLVLHARAMEYNNLFQSMQNVRFSHGYSLEAMKKDIAKLRQGMTEYYDFDIEKYAFYRPMGINGWTVVSTVPAGVITKRTAALSRNLVQLCAASMLVFILLLAAVFVMFFRMEGKRRENQAKSAFLANMSHDMRTPMNAIIGMSSIAGAHAEDPATVRDCLKKITLSSRHLLGLINDILDMARIESGNIVLNNDKFPLAAVFESTVDIIYPMVRNRHQQFSIRLHNIEQEQLCGDELRLNQIFINILTNAVKYTPEGGIITVDAEELPRKEDGKGWYRFSFTDNGIGMKPEFLDRIFTAFTREQDSKISKVEGIGLGMAITKQIVDRMGGTIAVSSEEGKGTVFRVTLPFTLCEEQEEDQAMHTPVLLAGGEREQAAEAAKMLKRKGVRVDWAPDARGVLRLMREGGTNQYQAVIIDRDLYDSGEMADVCKACGRNTLLGLADYDWSDIRAKADAMGITGFIQKPLFQSSLQTFLGIVQNSDGGTQFMKPGRYDFSGKKVLLAEDNEMNMEIISSILQETGAQICCTQNGAECADVFSRSEEGEFDLILMDIQMPVMNGCECARKIRAMNRSDSGIPIFAMSANAYIEDINEAARSGMSGYLTKPINLQLWLEEISRCLKP